MAGLSVLMARPLKKHKICGFPKQLLNYMQLWSLVEMCQKIYFVDTVD